MTTPPIPITGIRTDDQGYYGSPRDGLYGSPHQYSDRSSATPRSPFDALVHRNPRILGELLLTICQAENNEEVGPRAKTIEEQIRNITNSPLFEDLSHLDVSDAFNAAIDSINKVAVQAFFLNEGTNKKLTEHLLGPESHETLSISLEDIFKAIIKGKNCLLGKVLILSAELGCGGVVSEILDSGSAKKISDDEIIKAAIAARKNYLFPIYDKIITSQRFKGLGLTDSELSDYIGSQLPFLDPAMKC